MQEIRYKLIWMGQQLGPYTKTEIDQQLANNEIGRSHIVELPTGDRLPLGEFMDQLQAPQPQATQATAGSQQFYLAIGSQPQGPYSTAEVTEFIENGSIGDDIQILVEGKDTWQKVSEIHAFQGILYQAHTRKATMPTAAAQPETTSTEQSRKDITVFVEGQRYGPYTTTQILQGAQQGLIDGDALATRPGMPGATPLSKWNNFRKTPFQFRSSQKPATRHIDDGMLELTDALKGYIFAGLGFILWTPLALAGLFYGVRILRAGALKHGLSQTALSLLGLGLWGFSLMQTMGNAS
jgi:hypothetical protein